MEYVKLLVVVGFLKHLHADFGNQISLILVSCLLADISEKALDVIEFEIKKLYNEVLGTESSQHQLFLSGSVFSM